MPHYFWTKAKMLYLSFWHQNKSEICSVVVLIQVCKR